MFYNKSPLKLIYLLRVVTVIITILFIYWGRNSETRKGGQSRRSEKMRGVGGPLLCIGDLLADLGGESLADFEESSSTVASDEAVINPSDLQLIFEENYNELTQSLKGNDHSWTALTLKLCTALETADKLIKSTGSNIESLTEKVHVLETILARGDSTVAKAKDALNTMTEKKTSC